MARAKSAPHLMGLAGWAAAAFFALEVGPATSGEIIVALRVPRVVLAAAVGMGLSVAGAVLQALFANPLCEPYTLGISSGATLGAVVGGWLGLSLTVAGLTGGAFLGALVFTGILYFLSRRREAGNTALLLAGVMLGFLGSSLVALWMALADPNGVQGALFWLLGDLSRARIPGALTALGFVAAISLLLWAQARELDALLLGEEGAQSVGVDVATTRRRLLVLSALLVAACVSASGMIGFVGLVIPHFARRAVGSLHRMLIPLCAIWGAMALTLADGVARAVARPYELPVGVVTALIGAPLFLWIMLRRA